LVDVSCLPLADSSHPINVLLPFLRA
jgi:hypothetical protein